MGGLSGLAARSLGARRLRTFLSIVGIALGVGVLYASLAVDAGIESSIERTVRDLVGRADLRVAAFGDSGLAPVSVEAIAATDGIEVVAPAIERRTYLAPPEAATAGAARPVTILGVDPAAEPRIRDLTPIDGAGLAAPDEAVALVTERLADGDYPLGSSITVQGAGAPVDLRVVGVLAGDGPLVGAEGRTVVVPIETARHIFETDATTRVDLVLAAGADPSAVEDALTGALTAEPYVLSSPRDLAASLRASTADFRATTALVAAISLFVGAFLIFNTLSMSVVERIRELGLLRAAGATRSQVGGFVVRQALILGVIGSLAGVALGFLLAQLMAVRVRDIGTIPLDDIGTPWAAAVIAALIGVLVTLAASIEPARRAGSISPVEALKSRLDPAAARRARLRWLIVVFVAVALAGILVWPRGAAGDGGSGVVRALAVYGLLLVVVLVSPLLLAPLARIAGRPFGALARLEERLARASLARDRSRAALTIGALTIGLAMIVAIGGVAGHARAAASAWLAEVIPGEELVTSIRPVAEDEGVAAELAAIDGVARVSPIARFEVAHEGVRTDAAAIVGSDFAADGRLRFVAGDRETALAALDAGGSTVLPRSLAERLDVGVGEVLTMALGGGRVADLRVAGIAERTLPGRAAETLLVGWTDATNAFGVAGADVFAVRYEPGRAGDAGPALRSAARDLALEPTPLGQVAGAVDDALGRVFGLFDALALVAVIIAALGIVNTLSMGVLERVREIGVLRATGMTSRQVSRMVVVEAGILGLVGALLGIVAGLLVGGLMVILAGGQPSSLLDVPWAAIALAAALGLGASMLAAWQPARLAGRLSIVRAVQYE